MSRPGSSVDASRPLKRPITRSWLPRLWIFALLVAATPGCGIVTSSGSAGHPITPDRATAQRALEQALTAWVENRADPLSLAQVPIHFVDHDHRVGHRLAAFQILGATSDGRFPTLTVRLDWKPEPDAPPQEPEVVEYLVAGVEPIWVFRHDELQMLMHWDHPMPPGAVSTLPSSDLPPVDPQRGTHHEP